MKTRWLLTQPDHGSRTIGTLSDLVHSSAARKVARKLATMFQQRVEVREVGVRQNPTLVHHGLASAARWHLVSANKQVPLADLYRMTAREATRAAQDIATILGVQVLVLSNRHQPKSLAEHVIVRSAGGHFTHGPRSNPAGAPAVGEVWTDWRTGEKCVVTALHGIQIEYLEKSTGRRLMETVGEFLTTHKPPRTRRNPRMTLREWSEKHGIDMRQHKSGLYWIPDQFVNVATRSELWNLSDYLVTSVRGGTIWLDKRPKVSRNPLSPFMAGVVSGGVGGTIAGMSSCRSRRNPRGGPRIVYNKLLGGWYVVVGPHQTPLNGRFNSKAEAQAWLGRKSNPKRELSVPEKHQLKIARDTLKLSDAGARIMGGMTKEEARQVIRALTGREPKENPHRRPRANPLPEGARLAADGWVEMTRAQWAKIHRDFKGYAEDWTDFGQLYGGGTPSVMFNDGTGLALYPVRITDAPNKGRRVKRNPRGGGEVDDTAATELVLFIQNDGDLYRQQTIPILMNLWRKMKRGVYDHAKAVKLWGYLAESGAKKYAKEIGGGGSVWHDMFSVATRRAAAEQLAEEGKVALDNREFDWQQGPKKFKDLAVGEMFDFARQRYGQLPGPWRKTGAKTYTTAVTNSPLAGQQISVSSSAVQVKTIGENPARSRRARYGRQTRRTAPRGVPGAGSRRARRALRSGRSAKAHYHMLSTLERGRFRQNPESGWRSYGPGKFDSMVDSFLWSASLDGGFDEELGESEGFGFFGLMVGDLLEPAQRGARDQGDELTPEEIAELKKTAAAIMSEGSSGFVSADYFDTERAARAAWKKLEDEYEEFSSETEDNPVPRSIDRRSVRTLMRGGKRVLIGCPTGHYGVKAQRCRVATRAFEVGGRQRRATASKAGRRRTRGPRKARARSRNPRSEKEQAHHQFMRWQDRENARGRWKKVRVPGRIPRHLAGLGELVAVEYRSNKYDGKHKIYRHRTKRPRPMLATDPQGQHVYIVGGNMKVTPDGLVN